MPSRIKPAESIAPLAAIAIAQVQPKCSFGPQNSPDVREYLHHALDVLLRRRLEPELAGDAVVTQPPVRRARHDAMHAIVRQRLQDVAAVALEDLHRHPASAFQSRMADPAKKHSDPAM